MQKQKQAVIASVLMALRLRTGDPAACRFVMELAHSHDRLGYNIQPHLYPLWLDALCEAVEQHDPEFRPALEASGEGKCIRQLKCCIAAY